MKTVDFKPKETHYKGYRFRSRLEARWAVFFDKCDIKYDYEPEGFELSNGESYLPDFFLPEYNIFVEVKPSNKNFISHEGDYVSFGGKATEKYGFFMKDITDRGFGFWVVFGDPINALFSEEHGGEQENELFAKANCIVGMIANDPDLVEPNGKCICGGRKISPTDCPHKGQLAGGPIVVFLKDIVAWGVQDGIAGDSITALSMDTMIKWAELAQKEGSDKLMNTIVKQAEKMDKACKAARQARFEHGEIPTRANNY